MTRILQDRGREDGEADPDLDIRRPGPGEADNDLGGGLPRLEAGGGGHHGRGVLREAQQLEAGDVAQHRLLQVTIRKSSSGVELDTSF